MIRMKNGSADTLVMDVVNSQIYSVSPTPDRINFKNKNVGFKSFTALAGSPTNK